MLEGGLVSNTGGASSDPARAGAVKQETSPTLKAASAGVRRRIVTPEQRANRRARSRERREREKLAKHQTSVQTAGGDSNANTSTMHTELELLRNQVALLEGRLHNANIMAQRAYDNFLAVGQELNVSEAKLKQAHAELASMHADLAQASAENAALFALVTQNQVIMSQLQLQIRDLFNTARNEPYSVTNLDPGMTSSVSNSVGSTNLRQWSVSQRGSGSSQAFGSSAPAFTAEETELPRRAPYYG